jgi:hypothetical protein
MSAQRRPEVELPGSTQLRGLKVDSLVMRSDSVGPQENLEFLGAEGLGVKEALASVAQFISELLQLLWLLDPFRNGVQPK